MDDILKEIESLKKRVSELEAQKKDNLNMFGRSYNQVGNSNSDFLINTKGQIKIKFGNKFIDLIKDGKINVDNKFIFKEKSIGSKDGIYIIDGNVILVSDKNQIELASSNDTSYVSFLKEQETTSEQKQIALYNLGFIYPTINSVNDSAIKNGIVYIEDEQKLYVVENGILKQYS